MLDYSNSEYEIGVDEVGRGCLFGPVVSAAVLMPLKFEKDDVMWKDIKDSKKVSEKKRKILKEYIEKTALYYGIGECSYTEIDKINILQASFRSMHKAINAAYKQSIENEKPLFTKIIVDGTQFKPFVLAGLDKEYIEHECIEGGDNIKLNIAAASILAKCYRDNYIEEGCKVNKLWNNYDLSKNKGYGTKKHIEALQIYGPIEGHRLTYKPVYSNKK
jgi:ribonuclease HII